MQDELKCREGKVWTGNPHTNTERNIGEMEQRSLNASDQGVGGFPACTEVVLQIRIKSCGL